MKRVSQAQFLSTLRPAVCIVNRRRLLTCVTKRPRRHYCGSGGTFCYSGVAPGTYTVVAFKNPQYPEGSFFGISRGLCKKSAADNDRSDSCPHRSGDPPGIGVGKIFPSVARAKNLPSGSCNNCPERPIELALGNLDNRWNARFYWVSAFCLTAGIGGAVLAIDKVGQRDTRWLNPLTVSGWRQGEEGASQISGACSYHTAASAFSVLGIAHSL